MDQAAMPFRIGFEFQMNGKLCEWALDNKSLQKQPIFTISDGTTELCHVELDGPDIEFVTEHFSRNEKGQLNTCMKGIRAVIAVTKSQLDSAPAINFSEWLGFLSKIETIHIKTTPFFDAIKERTIKKLNPDTLWEPSWQPQMTVQHPLQSTIGLCNALFPGIPSMQGLIKQSTPTNIPPTTALAGMMFLVAHEMVGVTRSYLTPLVSDRLLDLSMALAMYFHEQDLTVPNLLQLSIDALSDPRLTEFESHPLMRAYVAAKCGEATREQQEFLSKVPKENPFIQQAEAAIPNFGKFTQIANDSDFMYKAILLRDTFVSYNTVHQFDAKRWTNFMSRRPFSHMFREILDGDSRVVSDEFSRAALNPAGSFLRLFNGNIGFADQLPAGFHLANYAEEFLDENHHPLDLSSLLEYFDPVICGNTYLSNLLRNGIFCTTMFSVMDIDKNVPNIMITQTAKELIREMLTAEYATIALSSIEQPRERNFLFITKEGPTIKIDAKQLAEKGTILDLLSPPFLLDQSDSMGRYREGIFHLKYDPVTFGSAIIEFRNIQLAKQLKSKGNNNAQPEFLTTPNFLEEEASNVFDVLSRLTIEL